MSQRAVQLTRVIAVVGVLGVVVGCASSGKQRAAKAQLERAQAAYLAAQADPNVQAYAQLRLGDAQKALRAAEQAKDSDEKMHLSYLTDTKAREAEQWRRVAESRVRDAETKAREAEQGRRQTDEADAKALAAEHAKATALATELANLKAQQTDRGMVLTVGDVLFAAGKAEVGPGAQRSIDKLADFLKAYPKRNVVIEGHTDNIGDEGFNIKLSQQRADAVRDLLVARGVAPQRIRTKGYGPKFPVVENDSAAGRQQNRRVEVLVLNEGVSAEGSTR